MSNDKIMGIKPVLEALKAGRPVQRLLVADQRKQDRDVQAILGFARECGAEVRFASRDVLNREAPGANHQGVIAIASAKQYATLDEILAAPALQGRAPLFLVLDGVEDPRNLGAIIRTADAAGVHGVIIPERRATGLTETVAKAPAGAMEHVPVVKVVNIVNTLEEFKKAGVSMIQLAPDDAAKFSKMADEALMDVVLKKSPEEGKKLKELICKK